MAGRRKAASSAEIPLRSRRALSAVSGGSASMLAVRFWMSEFAVSMSLLWFVF